MFDAKKIKQDFPIFENYKRETGADFVYLDSAASSQTPKQVVEVMDDYYFKYRSNIHRSQYPVGEKATNKYEEARGIVAKFIKADEKEVIFTAGATASSNMLIYSLGQMIDWKDGDEVVTSIFEHHSNLVPLQELAKRRMLKFKHFGMTKDFDFDYDSLQTLITDKTKIVSMTLASNVLGTINDARRIADIAHKHGAVVIVDATKAAGHMKIDVKELDCDFLFFSGHKVCGPTGIGILYGKKEFLEKMDPSFFGGGMVEDVDMENTTYNTVPARFEPGTPNIAGAIGLAEAIKYLESLEIENIQKHTQELTAYAIEKAWDIKPSRKVDVRGFDQGVTLEDLGL